MEDMSAAFHSPNVLSWLRLPRNGGVLVAATSSDTLRADAWKSYAIFAMLLLVSTALSLGVARLIARDCAEYEPDLLVVYMANNEVIGPYGPGTSLTRFSSNPKRTSIPSKLSKPSNRFVRTLR